MLIVLKKKCLTNAWTTKEHVTDIGGYHCNSHCCVDFSAREADDVNNILSLFLLLE